MPLSKAREKQRKRLARAQAKLGLVQPVSNPPLVQPDDGFIPFDADGFRPNRYQDRWKVKV